MKKKKEQKITRKCVMCKKTYSLTFFYNDKSRLLGLANKCKDCSRALRKRNRRKNIEHVRLLNREYIKKTKGAYEKVHVAIKKGILIKKPCVVCLRVDSQAHHEDYSKPLEVVWLCSTHHKQLHNSRTNLL